MSRRLTGLRWRHGPSGWHCNRSCGPAVWAAFTAMLISSSLMGQPLPLADQANVMEAQIQILRKRAELNQALAQVAGPGAGSLPRVLAIFGPDHALVARILMPGGAVMSIREGDVLKPGMKVLAIASRAVVLGIGSDKTVRSVTLDFVTALPSGINSLPPGLPVGAHPAAAPLPPELLPLPPSIHSGPASNIRR